MVKEEIIPVWELLKAIPSEPMINSKVPLFKWLFSYYFKLCKEIFNHFRYRKLLKNLSESEVIYVGKTTNFRTCFSKERGKFVFEEEYSLPIVEEYKHITGKDIVVIVNDSATILDTLPRKKHQQKYFPVEIFLSKKMLKIEYKYRKECIRMYRKIRGENPIYKIIYYKYIPELVRYILIFKHIIELLKPKIVIVSSWCDTISASFVAHTFHPDTVVLWYQEGVIATDGGWFKLLKDRQISSIFLPDYFLLQSKMEKELLLKLGYPDHKLKIIGIPRYDFLQNIEKFFDKSTICKKYNLDPSKKIVLWATQTHDPLLVMSGENEINCKNLFPFFYENKDKYEFIIKLHPRENQNAPLYRKWNRRFDNFAKIIQGNENIYELIFVSDCVLLKHSTVGMEAILLNRPILIIDFKKTHDVSGYTKYGFNVVKKIEDLPRYLSIIEEEEYKLKFRELRAKFIEDRVANFGEASKELVNFITTIINS